MNLFPLFSFLLINLGYFTNSEKATIEQCDTVMEYRVDDSCICTKDNLINCLKTLITEGTCTKENYPMNFIETPCSKMYSKCSSPKDECVIGACACFDAVVDCLIAGKCKPLTLTKLLDSPTSNKGVRVSDTAFNLNNLFDAHFEKIE
uniref:Uncharacterized protein n=1 Tax=Meloidogyne enterolobii TaxID=390850 RepID=A0A6V7XSV1_MELEN|nr:unnamed protein product [Meloidogyne enterolobii]